MPVDEETRRWVCEAFEGSYGAEVADSIMQLLPPAGVPELATKQDVASLGRELRAEMGALEARLGERLERALKEQATRSIRWTTATFGVLAGVLGALVGLGG